MLHYLNIYAFLFILALVLWEIIILIIVKILQDNDLEDEIDNWWNKQFTAILAFISLIKVTESSRKKRLYLFLVLLLLLLTIGIIFIAIKGGFDWLR